MATTLTILAMVALLLMSLLAVALVVLVPVLVKVLHELSAHFAEVARKRRARRTALAEAHGLTYDPRKHEFHGELEGRALRVYSYTTSNGNQTTTHYRMSLAGSVGMQLGPHSLFGGVSALRRTGDRAFDGRFRAQGEPLRLQAMLDAHTRETLLSCSKSRTFTLEADKWKVNLRSLDDLEAGLEVMNQLLSVLEPPAEPWRALCDAFPGEATRRRAQLVRLARHYYQSDDADAAELLGLAVSDPEPSVRLPAAQELQREDVLIALASDEQSELDIQVEAFGSLQAPPSPLVDRFFADPGSERFRAACVHIGARADRGFLAGMVERLAAVSPDAAAEPGPERQVQKERALAMAIALQTMGDPTAEPGLRALLAWDDDRIQEQAARALGLVGTVASIEALTALQQPLFERREVKQAAREAIRQLQEGVDPDAAGAVSLLPTASDEGALSLAEPNRRSRRSRQTDG